MTEGAPFLPYGRHLIDDDDIAAVNKVLTSEFLTTGPVVEDFERAFAARVDARYAVACSSGTAALHLAALALGLGEGDAVVVPTVTFLATANAVRYVGAEVVFADVDAESGLMTADTLADALESAPNAKAVFPVHLGGQTAPMEAITAIAADRGLRVVEDACHAVGASYDTADGPARVGSCRHAAMAAFSFHPVKTIAMGEGGAVTTNDGALHKRLAALRNHGVSTDDFENREMASDGNGGTNPWYYEMTEPGFNYRASAIHCALGLSQLAKLDAYVARRRALAERYDALLAPLAPVVRPVSRVPGVSPAWHLYATLIDFDGAGIPRARLMERLRAQGIGTQVHYIPVHEQPYYRRRYGRRELPGAAAYYARALSLPLFPAMTDDDVGRVVAALEAALKTDMKADVA